MKTRILLVLFSLSALSFGFTTEVISEDPRRFKIELKLEKGEGELARSVEQGGSYLRVKTNEAPDFSSPGLPEIPRAYRHLLVPANLTYKIRVKKGSYKEQSDVLLFPQQPDSLEGATTPFVKAGAAYEIDRWIGSEGVRIEKFQKLGELTLLPITFSPVEYNPRRRKIRIYDSIEVEILAKGPPSNSALGKDISLYSLEQASKLVMNSERANEMLRSAPVGKRLAILYPATFESYAREVGAIHESMGTKVEYAEVISGVNSAALMATVKSAYQKVHPDAVLLFGDSSLLPLASLSGNVGDYPYSLVEGSDALSDVAIGRIPASDANQAKIMVEKLKTFYLSNNPRSRRVVLLAHKENYPGKYTGNMENVKALENPKGLEFVTQYGGAGATNSSALNVLQTPAAIVTYRGHGSSTAWTGWAKDGGSFGTSQVSQLTESGGLPIYLNIACTNGAIQSSSLSIAERQLFAAANDRSGAIASIGATTESMTETNHRFALHLFRALQSSASPWLGEIFSAANNKLVQENGGKASSNVRMYLVLGDPLLPPL
jgi:hypothetical protein